MKILSHTWIGENVNFAALEKYFDRDKVLIHMLMPLFTQQY